MWQLGLLQEIWQGQSLFCFVSLTGFSGLRKLLSEVFGTDAPVKEPGHQFQNEEIITIPMEIWICISQGKLKGISQLARFHS